MMKYKTLIFDLDDTLVDFAAAEQRSLAHLYTQFFIGRLPQETFEEHFRTVNQALWQQVENGELQTTEISLRRFERLCENLGLRLNAQDLARMYETSLGENADWLPGAVEALGDLAGKFHIAIITNGLSYVQRLKFHRLDLATLCRTYIVSEEVGLSKPDKRIFDLALHEMASLPEQTLMVGDSLRSDYQGALNARLDFCWINPKGLTLPTDYEEPTYTIPSVSSLTTGLLRRMHSSQ